MPPEKSNTDAHVKGCAIEEELKKSAAFSNLWQQVEDHEKWKQSFLEEYAAWKAVENAKAEFKVPLDISNPCISLAEDDYRVVTDALKMADGASAMQLYAEQAEAERKAMLGAINQSIGLQQFSAP